MMPDAPACLNDVCWASGASVEAGNFRMKAMNREVRRAQGRQIGLAFSRLRVI